MGNMVMDKKSNSTVEVISLIISIIAIILSIISFVYTVYKDSEDSMEKLNIINSDIGYNETVLYDMTGGFRGQGMVSGINYSIIVSNNSKQKVSIVSYDISQKLGENGVYYGNMIEDVKDSSNQTLLFPISLDAGEALLVKFEINTLIPSSVNTLIMQKYGTEAEIDYKELQEYLGEYSRDIYGNEIEYTKYGDGNYLISIEEPKFPVYGLRLVTSKGNTFETHLSQGVIE